MLISVCYCTEDILTQILFAQIIKLVDENIKEINFKSLTIYYNIFFKINS
jgi:hypothetical protein